MDVGQLRFTKEALAVQPGDKYSRHFSVPGMVAILEADDSLRAALAANLPTCLRDGDKLSRGEKTLVATVTAAKTYELIAHCRATLDAPIAAPTLVPWSCPRCDKHYRRQLKTAIAHADRADCHRRHQRQPVPAPPPLPPPPPVGKRRTRLTWTRRLASLLQDEERLQHTPYDGCCLAAGKQCDDCLIIEALKLARYNQTLWDVVVYGDIDPRSAQAARHRSKHRRPDGRWVDPRESMRTKQLQDSADKWIADCHADRERGVLDMPRFRDANGEPGAFAHSRLLGAQLHDPDIAGSHKLALAALATVLESPHWRNHADWKGMTSAIAVAARRAETTT